MFSKNDFTKEEVDLQKTNQKVPFQTKNGTLL